MYRAGRIESLANGTSYICSKSVLLCSLPFVLSPTGLEFRELLTRQEKFVDDLVKLVKAVASEKADRPKKIERLQVSSNSVFLCFM